MSGERRGRRPASTSEKPGSAARLFGPMVRAGSQAYVRPRDLPRLLALWPHEIEDETELGGLRLLAKLRRALRAERRRAIAGHWSYDLNRHLGLLSAYRGELARLRLGEAALSRIAPAATACAPKAGSGNKGRG